MAVLRRVVGSVRGRRARRPWPRGRPGAPAPRRRTAARQGFWYAGGRPGRWSVGVAQQLCRWSVGVAQQLCRWSVGVAQQLCRWSVGVAQQLCRWSVGVAQQLSRCGGRPGYPAQVQQGDHEQQPVTGQPRPHDHDHDRHRDRGPEDHDQPGQQAQPAGDPGRARPGPGRPSATRSTSPFMTQNNPTTRDSRITVPAMSPRQ